MRKVIMSCKASEATQQYFKKNGYDVMLFKGPNHTYEAVNDHPDMHMFYDGQLFADRGVALEIETVQGESIGSKYPNNILYNVAKVGFHIIAKYNQTSEVLKNHFTQSGYNIIDVKQGYAKCSTAVIDRNSIITSDLGIHKQAKVYHINSLLIQPGHIELKGLGYGFIGGCCTRHDQTVFFNGDIEKHPSFDNIKAFVESRDLELTWLDEPLTDLGSFIIL